MATGLVALLLSVTTFSYAMLNSFRTALTVTLFAFLVYGCASVPPASPPAKLTNGVLTDAKAMTLYTFDRDVQASGKSACNGDCARNWLPFYAPDGARVDADYQIITRDDGKSQWAFKGKPLYFWPEDLEPGDKFGDGYNNLWRLITAKGPITVLPAGAADGY